MKNFLGFFLQAFLIIAVFFLDFVAAEDRLLMVQEADNRCDVSLWNPRDQETRFLQDFENCPDRLFTSEPSGSILYLDGATIIRMSIHSAVGPTELADLPDLAFERIATQALSRPLSEYEKMTASNVMDVRNIGISDSGVLWVHTGLVMAGDDDYDFLIKFIDDEWVTADFVHCGRFEVCEFAGDETKNMGAKLAPEIWDELSEANTFFVRDEHIPGNAESYWISRIDRYFEIEGQSVVLRVWTRMGPDSGAILTVGAMLDFKDGDDLTICEGQCRATLNGRYLLATRFWGGTLELYDLANGESVLGPLRSATWVDFPQTIESPP